jgi:hypothetical protein
MCENTYPDGAEDKRATITKACCSDSAVLLCLLMYKYYALTLKIGELRHMYTHYETLWSTNKPMRTSDV